MNNQKILIVGGSFDNVGGRTSEIIDKIASKKEGVMVINGGMTDFLTNFVEEGAKDYQIILWMPEEGEGLPTTNDVRAKSPKCVLIESTSKTSEEVSDEDLTKMLSDDAADLMIRLSGEEELAASILNIYGDVVAELEGIDTIAETVLDKKFLSEALKKKYVPAPEVPILLERLHIRVFDDSIDILYRPNHDYLAFVPNNEDGKAEVRRLAEMTREDFTTYLRSKHGRHRLVKSEMPTIKSSKLEEWYNDAWKGQTDRLFKELSVANPVEEPIWDE